MKRTIFLMAAAALVAMASASNLDVLDPNGKKIGTGTFKLTNAGGKITTRLVVNVTQQGAKIMMDISDVHTSAGDPLSQIYKMTASAQGNEMSATTKATITGKKATIVTSGMGQSETKSVTAAGSVNNKSVIWMTGKVPAVGTTTTCYELNAMTGMWSKSTMTYHGTRSVKLANRTVTAHCITSKEGNETAKVYFTSTGDLVKLESPQLTLVQR